jgi:hypothetical protein
MVTLLQYRVIKVVDKITADQGDQIGRIYA